MAGAVLSDDLIQVYVRVRAPADASASRSVDVDELGTIVVTAPSGKTESFEFDRVGGEGASQEEVFVETAKGIADGCLAGYNGTVLCYGQTGAGKTFTMHGPPPHRSDGPTRGLLARVVDHLFAAMTAEVRAAGRPEAGSKEINYVATVDYGRLLHYNVTCSFLEIYNEELTDLLCGASDMREGSNPPRPNGATPRKPACPPGRSGENSAPGAAAPLRLREDADRGVYVANLTCLPLANVDAAMDALSTGVASRAVGVTAMNKHSSRSHAVFSVQLHQLRASPNGKQLVRTSQLHLVDLAGSERAKETGASGTRLKESCKINCSLSVLSKVITQLVESRGGGAAARAGVGVVRVAYRESKLTHLLRDSLGGDSRTCIIANVTSSERSHNETLSTLRFAARAKAVRTRAVQQKVRQLEESSDVSHLQWWPATAEAPESASERHSKKLSAGRAEPKIGVAELEAECEALRHALGLAEHALCDREAEAEAERERHCAELAEAEAGRARAEEEARAQRAQIESERVQEARAAEKRARFEAEEQSDRAASQAVAAAQSSQVAAGLRDKLREAQGEVQAERGRRAKLGEALARAEAERDEARQLAARQQQLAEGHAAQVATAARLHSVEVLSLQRSRIKAVAALEEALRRSGKGAEADAVRRELRRLESLIGGASTLGGETNAAHGPGSTSRSPAAGSTTPGPRPRPSQPKRGHKLGSSPAARTPLSPAKPNSAGRHPASADKARPGSHRAATAPTSSVQTPSSSRQDPMVVSRILELGRVGVSVHEILATLTAEDYRCSNGAPWGRAQADGRVVVRVLLQHSVAPVIVDDDKLKGYAEDYAARLRSGEAGGAPQERLAVAERPGGGRVNGSRAGGAPSWTALAPASPS